MKNLKLLFLLGFIWLASCSDDDNEITPIVTCSDGIQNGEETGIDCGGSCSACEEEEEEEEETATCTDGLQNGDETGIDCGGSCEPCVEDSCEDFTVLFVETGKHGTNLLRSVSNMVDTLQITPITEVSMEATIPSSCTNLRIELSSVTADCETCWFFLPSLNENWNISSYNTSNNSQTFIATGTNMDLPLSNFGQGVYQIEYYVNDSLTHTNHIQSTEDELEPLIEDVDIWGFTSDGDQLYVVNDFQNAFYGIINPDDPLSGITNQFFGTGVMDITAAMAAKDGELYYYDLDARAIRKLNLTSSNPEPITVIDDVASVISMAFDGDVLYMTVSNGDLIDVGRADLAAESPSIVVISAGNTTFSSIDISNKTLYISDFYEGIATIDLTDESYPLVMNESYFSDGFLSVVSIKVTGTHVYYTSSGTIGRVDLASNEREVLVETNRIDFFSDIHIEDNFFIFIDPYERTVYKQDL